MSEMSETSEAVISSAQQATTSEFEPCDNDWVFVWVLNEPDLVSDNKNLEHLLCELARLCWSPLHDE